jgi:hypothetical protein
MRRRPATARVLHMTNARSTVTDGVGLRITEPSSRTEIPVTLWTDLVVAGQRVYIRTRRAPPLPGPETGPSVAER